MTVREYIGARYVPLFMGEWDINADYEPLSVVQHQGASYTSRESVPHGVDITNTHYWALTGNYNAQVEAYRQEVRTFDSRITANADAITANTETITEVSEDLATLQSSLEAETAARIEIENDLAAEITARQNADEGLEDAITELRAIVGGFGGDCFGFGDADQEIFVGRISGNDSNDGSDDNHMVKTLDRAFELANERNWADIAIRIRENGRYETNYTRFVNTQLHITNGGSATNVTIHFNELIFAYNSYFHLSAATNSVAKYECPDGIHMDGCSLYFNGIQFYAGTRFDINMSKGTFTTTELHLTDLIFRPINSDLRFMTNTKWFTNMASVAYFTFCRAAIMGVQAFSTTNANPSYAFRFDEGQIIWQTSDTTSSDHWETGALVVRSYFICDGNNKNMLDALATTGIGGNTSVIKYNTAQTILS